MSATRELSIALQSGKRPHEYAALARLTEDLGFDMLSIYADLFYQPPIVPLTIAAQATSRIRLGPAALNPWTLHPVEIAGQIASLDLVSNGRAYLGLTRGAWLDEIGISQDHAVDRMRDAIEVVSRLLAGNNDGYQGRTVRLLSEHALRYEPLRPRVPLVLGAWGERMLALAGEYANEVKVGGSTNPEVVPLMRSRIAMGATRVGRNPDEIGMVLGAVTIVDEDREVARAAIRREMALYLPVVARLDPTVQIDPELTARMARLVSAGDTPGAGQLIPDDLLDRFGFAGSPNDLIEHCGALYAAGATRIEFGTPHGITPERGIRLLGERVLPAVRGAKA